MMKKKLSHRILSAIICMALVLSYIPVLGSAAEEEKKSLAPSAVAGIVTDPGTAHSFRDMMGTDVDGNRYAGRVWVDKSVYKDGDTVVLNTKGGAGSSFVADLAEDEAFQIVFSALGSTMNTKTTVSTTGPMDVVLVLDTSTSMDDVDSHNVTRLERTIKAANMLLDDLLTLKDVRIAIVTYNKDSETVLDLAAYTNGIDLVVTDYFNNGSPDAGVVTAVDKNGKELGKDSGYTQGTNLQSGIDRGFNILANATGIAGRIPVAIVLTDGQANRASQEGFYEISTHNDKDGTGASNRNLYLSTLLNAAYTKTKIEANYGKDATVYTVGVDVRGNTVAQLLMNPADTTNGFYNYGNNWSKAEITAAYNAFQNWAAGQNVTNSGWTFDHNYPRKNGLITDAKIAENIYYADTYYDVTNAELEDTFQQIYEELSSGVFNPITSSTSTNGGTGVDDTPLIYVDFIGQHMEIKEIQTVTLFGASYGVVKQADGSYVVTEATGTNPTTNESWNTKEDIRIQVIEQADGTQKLEIRINQEILPIILEQVVSETVGNVSQSTITEYAQDPLRVFYTVGVDSDILLPGGEVDVSKLQGYPYLDDASGTVSFYSNRFGVENAPDASGTVTKGDAHVGFQPSPANRYYYHQANQGIFTKISDNKGNPVTIPENNEYGILWDAEKYDLTWMSYEAYQGMEPEDTVYTYVSYYRPTENPADAANAAQEITYLVYTNWKYLKESVAFYDDNAETYLNDGKAVAQKDVESVIAAYRQANPNAKLYAVLGVNSRRTSRLHNMMVNKMDNPTQTAIEHYTPEYLENKAAHNDNDVVIWLGNNGKLTVSIQTGIALTKTVTEPFGQAEDTYALTVTVPAGVTAHPVVVDEAGSPVASTYSGNVLTVAVKAGQTVYVTGIPGGTVCTIGEVVDGDYYIADKTDTVRVPLVSEVLAGAVQFAPAVVTNAPYKYGNLFITKEITSDHTVPEAVLEEDFTFTVNVGSALAGHTFTVEDSAHAQPYTVTVDNSGKLVFQLKASQTVEIFRLPVGTAVTVTETTPDSHFAVSYRTRNHSGETADTDNAVVIPANGSATAVVINHYTPDPVAVDLDIAIHKNFADASVADRLTGGDFNFLIEKYDAAAQSWTTLQTAAVSYGANEYGEKSVNLTDVLSGLVYTQVGTYSYRVSEVKGNVTNVSYDRTIYTFDVVVTDNGGQLAATVIDVNNQTMTDTNSDGSVDYITRFVNTYETAPISMDITKTVVNKSGDPTVSAQGFRFRSICVDQDGNPLDIPGNTIFSDAAGQARISGYYTREQIGTHYYIVFEENDGKAGWTYSGAQYFVTVVVAEDGDGNLTATMTIAPWNEEAKQEAAPTVTDSNRGQLHFTNTYDPQNATVDLDGNVFKVLTGKPLEDGQFTFHVYRDGDRTEPVLTGTNKRDGNVHFVDFDKALTFSGIGKYQYDVVENIPTGAVYDENTGKYLLNGMYYDATIFDLVVEVVNDPVTGKLIASTYFEDAVNNTVTFRNSYHAEAVRYTLGGNKLLHGRAPRNGEFTFELYEGDNLLRSTANKADGSFAFDAIAYTQPGTYTYTIREKTGNVAGVSYDGAQKPVTVTVTVTDQNGALKVSANKANADIVFENTYTPNGAQVTFNGTKTLAGAAAEDNAFTFLLYRTDASFDISGSSAQLLDTAHNVNGAFAFTKTLNTTGTWYFVIAEDASDPIDGIVYDRTQYHFAVRVSDSGDGQLKAVVTNMVTGTASATGAAVFADVAFTNAPVEEVTEKEVYLAGNVTTEIDGQKVDAGDILTYYITYTNYTGENVVADIMDTIPAHTSYVEGTASHGGTYAGTHLNWILHVARGESVTVSFDVRVDETEAIVANTAVVRDGVNVYHTNEVVNHTVDAELTKDVFSSQDATVSIDGKKVYAGDTLLYKISFTNLSDSAANITITDTIPANTTYVAGSADNGGVFADGVVTWNLEAVPAWSNVTVSFEVTVNENIGAATIVNQAAATDGTNQYETKVVTNYTVEDEVKKEVFNAKAPTVSIDGKAVENGDTLVYAITYRNADTRSVSVTITDTIPAYTTYVEGSANHGGAYADGKLTWKLEVPAGETVTVTFRVTVNSGTNATLTNKAQVLEGNHTYTTNEVSTSTTTPETPTTPETGDNTNLRMWFFLLFLSGAGVIVTSAFGKKKKEA